MAKQKAAVYVTVKKTKRKGAQRYQFTIDKPGQASDETKREFYTRSYTCWLGALRTLGAWRSTFITGPWVCDIKGRIYEVKRIKG